MDTTDLITHSRSRFDHAAAKRTLLEKYQGKLVFAYNGGMFKATPELITFLKFCESSVETVITDLYNNPIKVNVHAMTMLANNTYQEQMHAWLKEYEELNKNR
jgi:hypothetical protein